MNKYVAIVIVAVIFLGMGLVAFNEYINDGAPFSSPPPPLPDSPVKKAEQGEVVIPPPVTTGAASGTVALEGTPAAVPPAQTPIIPEAPVNTQKEVVLPVVDPALLPHKAEPYNAEQTSPVQPSVATEVQPAPKVAEKVIRKIRITNIGDGVTVRLDTSQFPAYKAMRLSSPERLVIDLQGTWQLRAPGVPKNPFINNVRIGLHKDGSRIVIDLTKAPGSIRYLKYGESGLDIRIR